MDMSVLFELDVQNLEADVTINYPSNLDDCELVSPTNEFLEVKNVTAFKITTG